MKLLTKAHITRLTANRKISDPRPVVKLFDPCGAATWLVTEFDAETGEAFGLADLGWGCPELGYFNINEMATYRGRFGLGIERDRGFKADKTLADYYKEARTLGRIAA